MPREPPQEVQRAEASPELASSEAWHNRQRIGWNSVALESSIITISASRFVLLSGAFVVNLHRERSKSVVGNTSGLTKRSNGEAINDAGYASIIDDEEWLRPLGDEGRRYAGVESRNPDL